MNPLALYLVAVLATIVPRMHGDRRESIATDIATVVLEGQRAFDDDATGQQTGLLATSLAHYETGRSWASWIDDGSCNEPAWRARHADLLRAGDCDGGHAWGMWQVHVPGDSVTLGKALVADRKAGIRAALAIATASLQAHVGLCQYSGEHYPHCRLAELRLWTARKWVSLFPFARSTAPPDSCTWIEPNPIPGEIIQRALEILRLSSALNIPLGTEYFEEISGRVYKFRREIHELNPKIPYPHAGVGVRRCD